MCQQSLILKSKPKSNWRKSPYDVASENHGVPRHLATVPARKSDGFKWLMLYNFRMSKLFILCFCFLQMFPTKFFLVETADVEVPKRIEYILEWSLLEKSVKRPFCCTVSRLLVYFTYLCYITFWALEHDFIENLKLILKETQIMK